MSRPSSTKDLSLDHRPPRASVKDLYIFFFSFSFFCFSASWLFSFFFFSFSFNLNERAYSWLSLPRLMEFAFFSFCSLACDPPSTRLRACKSVYSLACSFARVFSCVFSRTCFHASFSILPFLLLCSPFSFFLFPFSFGLLSLFLRSRCAMCFSNDGYRTALYLCFIFLPFPRFSFAPDSFSEPVLSPWTKMREQQQQQQQQLCTGPCCVFIFFLLLPSLLLASVCCTGRGGGGAVDAVDAAPVS